MASVGESRVLLHTSATYAAPHNGLAVLTSLRQYTFILLAETFAASERAPGFTDFLNLAPCQYSQRARCDLRYSEPLSLPQETVDLQQARCMGGACDLHIAMASLDVLPAALNLLVFPLCQLLATCTRLSWHPGKIKVFRIAIFSSHCNNIHDQLRASFNCCQLLRRLLPEAKAVAWKLGAQRTPWSAVANHKRTAALISKNIVLIKWSTCKPLHSIVNPSAVASAITQCIQ